MGNLLCEVRVPTYRRPVGLRRALESLIGQSHEAWAAVVLDDSPLREGQAVVAGLADKRIHYHPNRSRLGAARNIDQAFSEGAMAGGTFACVLEDDNWLMPTCLESNLQALERSDCRVLLRNQRVCENEECGDKTTLGALYRDGRLEPRALHARLFFGLGVSNGALFWRADLHSELRVGPTVMDTVLQEHCRTLQIQEPVVFAAEPLAIWSAPPGHGEAIEPCPRRVLSRGRQRLHAHLWNRYGPPMLPDLIEIAHLAGRRHRLEESLGYIGVRLPGTPLPRFLLWRLRSMLRAVMTRDPLADYFNERATIGRRPNIDDPARSRPVS